MDKPAAVDKDLRSALHRAPHTLENKRQEPTTQNIMNRHQLMTQKRSTKTAPKSVHGQLTEMKQYIDPWIDTTKNIQEKQYKNKDLINIEPKYINLGNIAKNIHQRKLPADTRKDPYARVQNFNDPLFWETIHIAKDSIEKPNMIEKFDEFIEKFNVDFSRSAF